MNALIAHVRERVRYWGARLNAVQAFVLAALIANADKLQPAIASIVPAKFQGAAGLIAGLLSYVVVEIASKSDAKKAAGNG